MKKIFEKIIIILIVIIILWCLIFLVNYIRCTRLKTPILMKKIYITAVRVYEDKEGNIHSFNTLEYMGLGYNIYTEIGKDNKLVTSKLSLFGKVIKNETNLNY